VNEILKGLKEAQQNAGVPDLKVFNAW
jgi:hypothetical protein